MGNTSATVWTPLRREVLQRLVNEGQSATTIANALSESEGVRFTRNAVISATHRYKIPLRSVASHGSKPRKAARRGAAGVSLATIATSSGGSPSVAVPAACKGAEVPPVSLEPPPPPEPRPAVVAANRRGITLDDLDRLFLRCRAVIGEVRGIETRFCGQPVLEGTSWCPECRSRVFARPAEPVRRDVRRSSGALRFERAAG